MKAQHEKNEFHQQILENAYLFLEVMEKVSQRIGIERKDEIAPAIARAEECLERVYSGDPIEYESYREITELARDIGRTIWNPEGETVAQRLAVIGPSENAMAFLMDNEPDSPLQQMPQPLWQRLLSERSNLLDVKTDALSPYQKMNYEMSLVSVNAGLEAFERLGDIELSALAQVDEKSSKKLPKLNVQFVSEPAMRVWAKCTAQLGALPADSSILLDALKEVEKGGRASNELREEVANEWGNSQPRLPREWIGHATNAIFGSATSTSLDTLDMSSATFCLKVFEDIYASQDMGNMALKIDDSVFEKSRSELTKSLESIDETLKELKGSSGARLPASLIEKISLEADNLRELVQSAQAGLADGEDPYIPGLS